MKKKNGSLVGFVVVIAMGFAFYSGLGAISGKGGALTYSYVVDGITRVFGKQILWFLMNFVEAQFYAGVFAGAGIILGGIAAWFLAKNNSRLMGFSICYGSPSIFPWVLASQLLSLGLAIFVYRYIGLFDSRGTTWIATFITVVGAPPSIMLLYGPSLPALLVGSAIAGLFSAPFATWLAESIIVPLKLPGVVSNVLTMAFVGILTCMLCRTLPWVEKKPIADYPKTPSPEPDVFSAGWFVRRCLADFSEAQFYGNEVASVFLLIGVTVDWMVNKDLPSYGSGALPAIILSQFVGTAVGVLLYANKFDKGGWYATYVPVVSVGPACVLLFDGTVSAALFSGLLGGIIGAPLAEFFKEHLPEGVHVTNANVLSMAASTTIVATVMKFIGCF